MTTEHQPGSPGAVDLDALERRLELDLGSWGNSKKYAAVFAELRTLRARVGELEAYAEDIKTISKRGRKIAELEVRAESAEARAGELEQCVADLEYELKAAREEQGLEAKVREVLGPRYQALQLTRLAMSGIWQACWCAPAWSSRNERKAQAPTLPALLRAILAVEKGGPDEG